MECSSSRQTQWFTTKFNKLKIGIEQTARSVKKLAKDDPRRIIHGLKVALGITLVSLLYTCEPLFEGYGVAAMWAVLTVVVVFEFSVGATLGKGLNRVFATVFGGMLGVGAHIVGSFAEDDVEPFILAIFDDEVFDQSNRRISAILVGCSAAVAICILICPVWAGADLHNLTANNIDKLANFLQEFGDEYFKQAEEGTFSEEKKELMEGFKSVLNSKNNEDLLKIGDLTRQLASTIESLNRYLHPQNQAPKEVKAKIESACKKMSVESGKALQQISTAMKSMAHPPYTAQAHLRNSQWACETLNTIWAHQGPIAQFASAATVASLLLDAVSFSVSIAECVRELAVLAPFKDTLDDDTNLSISSSTKEIPNIENRARLLGSIMSMPSKLCSKVANFAKTAKKIGQDDPRRVFHAIKVGVAISLVSLFYYLHPLYDSLGVSAMWAVLTVVVIFEFSVGGTLGKGINRVVATCLAGALGIGIHHLANKFGSTGEPIVLMMFGFIVAIIFTFMRFFPKLKARYDYGLMIFILTFSLVAVSGFRDDEVFDIASKRLSTIIIGCCIAILVCILICPVWSGSELHNLIASNIDKLGCFLEGFGDEFFKDLDESKSKGDKSFLVKYKSVLTTKNTEDIMANLARWEPGHGKFRFFHPWAQYLKIGALTRQCAYKIDALNTYLNSDSKMQPEIEEQFKKTCKKLSSESGKALRDLSNGVRKMKRTLSIKSHLKESKSAAENLKSLLENTHVSQAFHLLELLPTATVASLLIEIMTCVEEIAEEIHELGNLAKFKIVERAVVPEEKEELDHVVVVINDGLEKDKQEITRH
ncbi:hypothetical protein V2J09_011863 [Rumex salicifolius]